MSEPEKIGRYRILEELGRGAMGKVVKADDPTIQRQVAIKIIRLGGETPKEEQELFERSFLREVRAAGVLHHPGIISVFDAGRQDDLAYIVMELVDGVTLEALLNSEERPEMGYLLEVCRQAAAALDYAHGHGIVHRDIKPANVLVARNGAARIADFGIAKVSHNSTLSIGKSAMAGTPAYMSPEQVTGQPLDGRADQWSLAAIVYNVLTASAPFASENIAVLLGQIMTVDPAPPSEVNPLLPPAVDAVMTKAFAKDPARRHSSCMEMMRALDEIFAILPAEPGGLPEGERPGGEAPAAEVAPAYPQAEAPVRKQPGTGLIVGATAALVALVIGGILLTRHNGSAGKDSTPFTVAPVDSGGVRSHTSAPAAVQPATPAQPVRAERPASAAPAKLLQIRFSTTPSEADVTVDGKRDATCKSPCSMELTEGAHTLLLQKDGFRTVLQNFTASSSQPEVAIALNELTGSLLVQTEPPGAAIVVNGKPRAEITPATLTLPPGKYKITVNKPGFAPADFEASVMADAVREVSVGLVKSQ